MKFTIDGKSYEGSREDFVNKILDALTSPDGECKNPEPIKEEPRPITFLKLIAAHPKGIRSDEICAKFGIKSARGMTNSILILTGAGPNSYCIRQFDSTRITYVPLPSIVDVIAKAEAAYSTTGKRSKFTRS